jgi:hypothetical protein
MGANPSKLVMGPSIGETLQSMGFKNSFVELPPGEPGIILYSDNCYSGKDESKCMIFTH